MKIGMTSNTGSSELTFTTIYETVIQSNGVLRCLEGSILTDSRSGLLA
jgi:hypothetical protein